MANLPLIEPERTLQFPPDAKATAVEISPSGHLLAAVDDQQTLWIWSLADGQVVRKHRLETSTRVERLAWSPDHQLLLLLLRGPAGLWLLDHITGITKSTRRFRASVVDATWLANSKSIVGILNDGSLFEWSTHHPKAERLRIGELPFAPKRIIRSPASDLYAVFGPGRDYYIFRPDQTEKAKLVENWHLDKQVGGLAWSRDERHIAIFPSVSAEDSAVITVILSLREYEPSSEASVPSPLRPIVTLEGHQAAIIACEFSGDGRHLVSIDNDSIVIIWDFLTQKPVFRGLPSVSAADPYKAYGICGAPLRLVEVQPDRRTIVLYDLAACLKRPVRAPSYVRHTSAKVVIAGEARVGKTSLAHRLVEDRYVEHDPTHGMKIWPMPPESLGLSTIAPAGDRREVILWDLGGQEEYQLIHQLFLRDTTVALLLFDPARGAPALEEVDAWSKRLAKQLHDRPVRKLLVGTKQDADVPVDLQSIDGQVKRCGSDGYYPTSAKEGHGLPELRDAIARAIDWGSLSTVSRPELFQRIRDEIDARRSRGEVVLHYLDLVKAIVADVSETLKGGRSAVLESNFLWEAVREEGLTVKIPSAPDEGGDAYLSPNLAEALVRPLDTVVRQLALQGVLAETRDAQSERTLILQIGEVERYAGSLIIAARDSPSGVPALEKSLFASRLKELPRIPPDQRLAHRDEHWVLQCVLKLMLEHGLCVEHAGLYIFPTLFRTTDGLLTDIPASTPVFYEFSGAIDNIYSSLVTAFALAKRFGIMRLGKNRAEFEGEPGAVCGLRKEDQGPGVAHLDVYFCDQVPTDTRDLFLDFVHDHLWEHGVEMVERIELRCSGCGHVFDEVVLRARLAKGEDTVLCPINEHRNRIALAPRSSVPSAEQEQRIVALRGEIAQQKREAVERAQKTIQLEESPPRQPRSIRILHLSDLHVSASDDVDSLLGPLLADLEDPREGVARDGVDYLVVSGDLTNRASPDELGRARELLLQLIERLHISAQRCVIVPGNHDLSWDEDVYEFKMKRQAPEPRDSRLHVEQGNGFLVRNERRYPDRFKSFSRHLFFPLFQREYPLDPHEQGYTALFPEHGLQFLAFNSAWEIDEHFPDRSAVHEVALERCLKRAADDAGSRLSPGAPLTRIAVWHHPVTGNEKIAADAFLERLRQADVRLCLHGHVHEDRADVVAHTDPVRKLYAVGAGSFGAVAKDRPESTPRLYNVLEIDPAHRWFRVHTRARPRTGGAWGPWATWPSDRPGERRAFYEKPLPDPLAPGGQRP